VLGCKLPFRSEVKYVEPFVEKQQFRQYAVGAPIESAEANFGNYSGAVTTSLMTIMCSQTVRRTDSCLSRPRCEMRKPSMISGITHIESDISRSISRFSTGNHETEGDQGSSDADVMLVNQLFIERFVILTLARPLTKIEKLSMRDLTLPGFRWGFRVIIRTDSGFCQCYRNSIL
jgi:hypothetical protein